MSCRLILIVGIVTSSPALAAETLSWTQITPSTSPGPRSEFGFSYDSDRHVAVLFGGYLDVSPGDNGFADTWEWDGSQWLQKATGGGPSLRFNVAMTYDSARQYTLLFGGAQFDTYHADTWKWDGTSWAEMCTAAPCSNLIPPARRFSSMAFDSHRGVAVLFGGILGAPISGAHNDTWEWNGSAWSEVCTSGCTKPPPRSDHAMAFDSARNVIVLFGGQDGSGTRMNDVWEWDGSQWAEKCTSVECMTNRPQPVSQHTLVFDAVRGRTLLFGGYMPARSPANSSEVWEWNGVGWTELVAATGPSGRFWHGAALDPLRKEMVVYGGEALQPDNGGYAWNGETWTLRFRGGACSSSGQCHSGNCVDNVCCEVASCGACETCNGADPGVCTPLAMSCQPPAKSIGEACSQSAECASGYCADGVCCTSECLGGCNRCDGALPGICVISPAGSEGSPSCGVYVCGGLEPACPTQCTADANCAASYRCVNSVCALPGANGEDCAADAQCASGHCSGGKCVAQPSTTPAKGGCSTADSNGMSAWFVLVLLAFSRRMARQPIRPA